MTGIVNGPEEGPGAGPNSITLAWDAPTTHIDGSPLADLAGYKLYYGTESGDYTEDLDVGNFTSCSIDGLSPGTWYFVVTAYDLYGNESGYSNEVAGTIRDEA